MAPVGDFLDEMAALGWQWGQRDCLLWLGLWSERNTGIDGGSPWRGRYSTARGCVKALLRSGGMDACVERGTAMAGLSEASVALPGAVGLVPVLTSAGIVEPVGGIFTGQRWAVLRPSGVLSVRTPPIRCWNLP